MDPIDPRAPPPPQERMRPILFCSWDLSEHEKWMPPSPNWDGLPVDYIYMYVFPPYLRSIDRDKILVSKSMFMWMRNPMITLKSPYDSWLTQNSKWLPSKPAEITLISQWVQYWQYTPNAPARNVRNYVMLSLGLIPTWKVDATTTKLGWTTIFKMAPSEVKLRFRLLLRI